MKRILITVLLGALMGIGLILAAPVRGQIMPPTEGGPPVKWVEISPPMEKHQWSVVEDIGYIDPECKSDLTLPRVCLYRHLSKCRIITTVTPSKLPQKVLRELITMCNGWFPEPVLLYKNFSDPSYLPNQAAPSVDPVFKKLNSQNIETSAVRPHPMARTRKRIPQ